MAARADLDIFRRSISSIPAYFLLWLAIAGITDFYTLNWQISFYVAAAFGGVMLMSLLFIPIAQRLFKVAPLFWRLIFYLLTFSSAVIWSALYTLCFFSEVFEVLFLPMTLATAGLTNVALSNFAPSRWVCFHFAFALYICVL